MSVMVAVPTYKRREALGAALMKVTAQAAEHGADVLVIDNDPDGSARDVAAMFGVRYVIEPQPGIAAVRNLALDHAADDSLLVFIDDDEVPGRGWLSALIAQHERTHAAAVAGRVITRFPLVVEPWVRDSGAFHRAIRYDGSHMREAATNNLLLDISQVRALGVRFDERFGLTGGSDSMFTRTLTARGGRIVWSQDAVVFEQEDAERFTRSWVLMRAFRYGNTATRVDVTLARVPLIARIITASKGAVRVASGSTSWLIGRLSGSAQRQARAERVIHWGAGRIAGAVGHAHNEYGNRRAA